MDFKLETNEAELLTALLTRALANLREEIYKTEKYDLRQSLHEDEVVIKNLLERLGHPIQTFQASGPAA